jgi:hypothetical protein
MDLHSLERADRAFRETEDAMLNSTSWGHGLLGKNVVPFFRTVQFLWLGTIELLREVFVMSVLIFAMSALVLQIVPENDPDVSAIGISNAIIFACMLLAFFSSPSSFPTRRVPPNLVAKTLSILRNHGLDSEAHLRATAIDLLDQALRDRKRKWLGVAASLWALDLIILRNASDNSSSQALQEFDLFFALTFGIVLVAWAYAKSSEKFICLLKYCDAILLDEGEKVRLSA